jgi:hypothetical protein
MLHYHIAEVHLLGLVFHTARFSRYLPELYLHLSNPIQQMPGTDRLKEIEQKVSAVHTLPISAFALLS